MIFVHAESESICLCVDDPLLIRSVIRQSRTIDDPNYNAVVRWTVDNVRVLHNLGIEVPMPPYDFPGKHKPFAHQIKMFEFGLMHPRFFNLSEPGTMKTAPTLWAVDQLMLQGIVKRAIIITTLSTLEPVWEREIFETVSNRRTWAEAHGSPEKRAKAMARDVDFYVTNHHGVATKEVFEAVKTRKDINMVIVDEGSVFRQPNTDMYKALFAMIRPDQRVAWLTGGPCPNEPPDAWSQCRIINPHAVPKHKGTFKRETMIEVSKFRWVHKPGAMNRVYEVMQPAIRFEKKDVIDLPPVVTLRFQTQMTPEQSKMFKDMKNDMTMEMAGGRIDAVNAADKITKLRQILCGCIKRGDAYETIPHGPRFNTLCEIIDGAKAKVIVIVPFKGIIKELERELRAKRFTVGVINGDVPPGQRKIIISNYKNEVDPHILLCHPKVMAHGLNLTEADLMVCYAPIYGNDDYSQVIERFNRAGQKNKMTIARIAAHPIEWEIYKSIDNDAQTQKTILDLYRQVVES